MAERAIFGRRHRWINWISGSEDQVDQWISGSLWIIIGNVRRLGSIHIHLLHVLLKHKKKGGGS